MTYAASWEESLLESQRDYVGQQLAAGVDPGTIVADLTRFGADPGRAHAFVAKIASGTAQAASAASPAAVSGSVVVEAPALGNLILEGGGPALAIAVLLGLVAMATDLSFGALMTPIGLAAGYATRRAAKAYNGLEVIVVAVVATLVGIAVERYFVFVQAVHDIAERIGVAVPGLVPGRASLFFKPELVEAFVKHPGLTFPRATSWLFLGLALVLAVRVSAREH